MKSNFLTPFLQDGLVLQCTEHWHLEELENAGVYGVSKLDAQSLPMYIKLYKHPRLGYDFTWTQELNCFWVLSSLHNVSNLMNFIINTTTKKVL